MLPRPVRQRCMHDTAHALCEAGFSHQALGQHHASAVGGSPATQVLSSSRGCPREPQPLPRGSMEAALELAPAQADPLGPVGPELDLVRPSIECLAAGTGALRGSCAGLPDPDGWSRSRALSELLAFSMDADAEAPAQHGRERGLLHTCTAASSAASARQCPHSREMGQLEREGRHALLRWDRTMQIGPA